MIKKEIIGDCTLYLGDCLEIMPMLGKVDAVVTDPPYGINASNPKRGGRKDGKSITKSSIYQSSDWDQKPCNQEQILSIFNISNYQIIFGGNYFELPPTSCWLIWDKVTGKNDYADFEMIWTNLKKACRMFQWQWKGMFQQDMKNKEIRYHPTQKPIPVMEWCINHLPKDCKIILDPFMGSGTTGIACVKLGRKFIGIEKEPEYFDISCRRIEEAYRQPDIFIKNSFNQPEQVKLID